MCLAYSCATLLVYLRIMHTLCTYILCSTIHVFSYYADLRYLLAMQQCSAWAAYTAHKEMKESLQRLFALALYLGKYTGDKEPGMSIFRPRFYGWGMGVESFRPSRT